MSLISQKPILCPQRILLLKQTRFQITTIHDIKLMLLLQLTKQAIKHTKACVVVTQPLTRDGGVAEDNESPGAGKFPRPWSRGRRETNCRQRASGAKIP